MSKSEANTGAREQTDARRERIESILESVRLAKHDAQQLELKFEAYLLEMATMALSEQLQTRAATRN